MGQAELDKKKWSSKELVWFLGISGQTIILYFTLRLAISDEINARIADVRVLEEKIKYLEKQLPSTPNDKRAFYHKITPAEKPEYELAIVTRYKKRKS